MPLDLPSISSIVIAIGALGTSSSGLVDATKVLGGGISLAGLGDLKEAILPLFGGASSRNSTNDLSTPATFGSVYASLKANWLNGVSLAEQKANAAVLVKLTLNANTAPTLARATGVSPEVLTELAVALNLGAVLTKEETDVLARFETALNLILDRAFQRADQRYRSGAKALACVFSVLLAIIAGAAISSSSLIHTGQQQTATLPYWSTGHFWLAVIAGLVATPIAPIVKDLTRALAAGSAVARRSDRKVPLRGVALK